jgi:hypothetical protein
VNAVSVEADTAKNERSRTFLDRALAALPIAGLCLLVVSFYLVEAWTRKTPWLFTDELEWTQISRALAETGHGARRGEPIYFKSLYTVLMAPFWWIHSTETAYAGIKYMNAVVMSAAAIPTYYLGRMVLQKRTALVVAVLAVCIPGMSYVTTLRPEVLAYTWYALSGWIIVRALVNRRPVDYALVVLVSVGAMLVRTPQFASIPISFLTSAAILWVTGERCREWRRGRSRGEIVGTVVLLIGAFVLFNRIFLQKVQIWQISTQYWKDRMVDLGLEAWLAVVVGLGIVPVVAAFLALNIRERRGDPAYKAFAAYLASTLFFVTLYTALKQAYLSTVYATLTEERNMIYMAPPILIGAALAFEARRLDWRIVLPVSAVILYLIFEEPMQLLFPYYEAPGFAVLAMFNRWWWWDVRDLQWVLTGVLALSIVLLALRRFRVVVVIAALFVASWMLTAEIASTVGFTRLADKVRHNLPAQLDWIDRATDRAPVTYLGQRIENPNGVELTEFWNRSIKHVYSLDGTAPGPGPAGSPEIVGTDGRLKGMPPTQYVVADNGVALQAPVVDRWNQLTLYRKDGPWKLRDQAQQLSSDGWIAGWGTYTYFIPGQSGVLEVTLSRTGYNGTAPPGRARVIVGTIKIVPSRGGPVLKQVYRRKRTLVRNGQQETLRFAVAKTPVRAEIRISPTFQASASDPRQLGAQVAFRFVPTKQAG